MARMPGFDTEIKQARFRVIGYQPHEMLSFARSVSETVAARVKAGVNINDVSATPLKEKYAKWKARKFPPAVRNWVATGKTMSTMHVLEAGHNRAVIGFVGPVANRVVAINNARERQFGVSQKDRAEMIRLRSEMQAKAEATFNG